MGIEPRRVAFLTFSRGAGTTVEGFGGARNILPPFFAPGLKKWSPGARKAHHHRS